MAAIAAGSGTAAGGAVAVPPVAPAGAPSIGTLGPRGPVLHFAGGVTNPTPFPLVNAPVPIVCAVTCQAFRFTTTTNRPFLVSVRDTSSSPNNGWDLYVYDPAGAVAGSANGIGADGQAVAVERARRGTYEAVVTYTYAEDPGARYRGEVRTMSGRDWRPAAPTCGRVGGRRGCFALPRLEAVPASDLHVTGVPPVASTPLGFPLPVSTPTPSSCYLDESLGLTTTTPDTSRLTNPAQRCLRFTTNVRNVGAGPFDIRIPWAESTGDAVSSGFVAGQCVAQQGVHRVDGAVLMRSAGGCLWHAAHAHFHYRDLVAFSLHAAGKDRRAIGRRVASSVKASFCLADDEYFGFGTAGPNGPRVYVGQPGCNEPSEVAADAVRVAEGITPGWGDVYTWDTPDQYIDITNLSPGRYALVEKTNPSGVILVAGPQTTCSATFLDLTATTVRMLKQSRSIPCPTS